MHFRGTLILKSIYTFDISLFKQKLKAVAQKKINIKNDAQKCKYR